MTGAMDPGPGQPDDWTVAAAALCLAPVVLAALIGFALELVRCLS